MKRDDGQYTAFEVSKIIRPYIVHRRPAILEHTATVWDKEEADILNHVINGVDIDPYSAEGTVQQIGIILLGSDAYYDTEQPPLPVELVAETADDAVSLLNLVDVYRK